MDENIYPHMQLYIVGAALIALAVLAWRGCFRWSTLENSPQRHVNLGIMDLAIALGWILIGSAISLMIITKLQLLPPASDIEQPTDPEKYAFAAILNQLIVFLPVCLYVIIKVARNKKGLVTFGLLPKKPFYELLVSAVGLVCALVLVIATLLISKLVAEELGFDTHELGHDALKQMTQAKSKSSLWLMITSAVIVAPFFEEIIYRGLMQTALNRFSQWSGRWIVVVASAAIFTVIHVGGMPGASLPGIFVLGILLGWIYEKTQSLLPCIIIHAAFNAFNVAMVLILIQQANQPIS